MKFTYSNDYIVHFHFQSLDTPQYSAEPGSSESQTVVEETSTNSLDQDAVDSNDRQQTSNNDSTWQSNTSNEEKSNLTDSIPNPPDNVSSNSEPPLKVPKLSTSNSVENTWENSPSSQSSAEWHIPTSNSSSASEGAGDNELPETGSTAAQNNVQVNSESSNSSLSRTSFNDGKEIQLPKTTKNKPSDEFPAETTSTNDVDNKIRSEDSAVNKEDENPNKAEIVNDDHKDVNSSLPVKTNDSSENSEQFPGEINLNNLETSPLSDEFWKKQNPLVDHVLITDVTKNHLTVTVRECDTSSGFFKDRPRPENAENLPKEDEENSL